MFLMLLTCYLAAAVKNHWTGWISCLPVALLLLVRPTYALIFVAALACPGMSKWFIRLLLVTIAIFAMTLHYDGIARWLEFPVQVRASQAVRMERNLSLIHIFRLPASSTSRRKPIMPLSESLPQALSLLPAQPREGRTRWPPSSPAMRCV